MAPALHDMCPATKGLHHYDVHWPPAGQYGYTRTICRYCGKKPQRQRVDPTLPSLGKEN